jgi:hypothetical protein
VEEFLSGRGALCEVTDAINLHVKLLSFSWDHEFKVLKGGLFPAILGLDFFTLTKMVVEVASQRFSFGFAPDCSGLFCTWETNPEEQPYLQNLSVEV